MSRPWHAENPTLAAFAAMGCLFLVMAISFCGRAIYYHLKEQARAVRACWLRPRCVFLARCRQRERAAADARQPCGRERDGTRARSGGPAATSRVRMERPPSSSLPFVSRRRLLVPQAARISTAATSPSTIRSDGPALAVACGPPLTSVTSRLRTTRSSPLFTPTARAPWPPAARTRGAVAAAAASRVAAARRLLLRRPEGRRRPIVVAMTAARKASAPSFRRTSLGRRRLRRSAARRQRIRTASSVSIKV